MTNPVILENGSAKKSNMAMDNPSFVLSQDELDDSKDTVVSFVLKETDSDSDKKGNIHDESESNG